MPEAVRHSFPDLREAQSPGPMNTALATGNDVRRDGFARVVFMDPGIAASQRPGNGWEAEDP
jgi:hypothetical protein